MIKEDEYDSLAYKHYCIGIGYDRKNVYLKVEGKILLHLKNGHMIHLLII